MERKTNYRKRVKYLSSRIPRVVIRNHTNNIILQLILFNNDHDQIIITTHSSQLKKFGWPYHRGNIPSAYLSGYLFGKKIINKKINKVVIDLGIFSPNKKSRPYAAIKGLIDAGVETNQSNEKIFPDKSKIHGDHIRDYFTKINAINKIQFSTYQQKNLDMNKIGVVVDQIKCIIDKEK